MIGDFEFIIDDHTSKMDIRQWYKLVSESGCSVEFVPKTPYPVLNSKWRHLDFGNVCINYIHNTRPLTAIHVPDLKEVRQNRNFKLVYNDSPAVLTHYDRRTRIPAESFVLLENAHPFELDIEPKFQAGVQRQPGKYRIRTSLHSNPD